MAINPLVVFVGLSVTTLGGLFVVASQNQGNKAEQALTKLQPSKKQVPLPVPAEPTAKAKIEKKLASLPPGKTAETVPPPPLPSGTLKPLKGAPTFDVVRIEGDGGAVVVGKAPPGSTVVLKMNGKVIAKSQANKEGDWVFVPDQLVPKGSHELTVEATDKNNKTVRSEQSIIVAMPEKSDAKPLIVISKPDAPSRVLQKPEQKVAAVKKPVQVAVAPTQKTEKAPVATNKTPVAKTPETTVPVAGKKTVEVKVAAIPPKQKIAEKTPVQKPVVEASKQPVKSGPSKLAFGTVDYNDGGDIVFSGKSTPDGNVRIYVDNKFVGDAKANEKGVWVYRGKGKIKPGVHELRADQLDAKGKVAQRVGVPFVRANPDKVAALLKKRGVKIAKAKPVESVKKTVVVANKQPDQPAPAAPPAKTAEPAVRVAPKAADPGTTPEKAIVKTAKVGTPEKLNKTDGAIGKKGNLLIPKAGEQVDKKLEVQEVAKVEPAGKQPETPTETAKQVSHVVIQPGNNLWNISRVIYGKGIAYTTIFEANKEQIRNPNRIYPGQIFDTPGVMTSGTVSPDMKGLKTSEADGN